MTNKFQPIFSPIPSERYLVEVSGVEKPKNNNPNWFAHEVYETHLTKLKKFAMPNMPSHWADIKEVELGRDFGLRQQIIDGKLVFTAHQYTELAKLPPENNCEECNGTGEIERNIDGADVPTVCGYCLGTGKEPITVPIQKEGKEGEDLWEDVGKHFTGIIGTGQWIAAIKQLQGKYKIEKK